MARTPAQKAALEKKALAEASKSEGMRQLFDAGYEAADIKELFGAPYGFVYGVGVRHGAITPEPKTSKPKAAKATTKTATARAAKATTAKAAPARAAKAPAKAAAKTKARAKA